MRRALVVLAVLGSCLGFAAADGEAGERVVLPAIRI